MKILVCISKTPDTTAKIAFTDNNTKFAEAGVQWIINPYDEWYEKGMNAAREAGDQHAYNELQMAYEDLVY